MLPLDISSYGQVISLLTFGLVGFAFGMVLEVAGFGNATKLAAQFYLKDMTVLKVMFTGILTACLLIFGSAALGLLDFSAIFVNPTFLWAGIVGGLVMGAGFVVGGYCPGTSVVSSASLKLDGILFFVGTIIGAGLFGEVVSWLGCFWNEYYTERLLVSDWLGWSVGATVVGVTLLALSFFYGAEKIESYMADPKTPIKWKPTNRRYIGAAAIALIVALFIWGIGQPTPEQKWTRISGEYQQQLDNRDVFIHPLEYVKTWNNASIKLVTLDLRPEADFKAFHLDSAKNVTFEDLVDKDLVFKLSHLPSNGVAIIVADDEAKAVRAWKRLKAQGVLNLYILDKGLSGWKEYFSKVAHTTHHFNYAKPPAKVLESFPKDAYTPKIKLKTVHRAAGLCS